MPAEARAARPTGLQMLAALLLLLATPVLAAPAPDADAAPPAGTDWLPRSTAELRVLDTQSAQASTLTLEVGQTRQAGSLAITLRACRVHPPDQRADAAALLDVVDAKGAGMPFHGWMLAAEPQLAMLENPSYGLLLVACR